MPTRRADPALIRCLEEIRQRHGDTVRTRDVVEVVHSAMSTLGGDLSAGDMILYGELGDLAKFIRSAKEEIQSIHPEQVKEEYLPAAADELDAVVAATAEATNAIMDATEIVENVMAEIGGDHADKLMDATTRIYEACGFQDITGQRINKVVGTLKHIEEKVDALLATFGADGQKTADPGQQTQPSEETETGEVSDEVLLQGPQLPEDAMSQNDIDLLLASFD